MPYVSIRITREKVSERRKKALIKGATDLPADVLSKNPATTVVTIGEAEMENWGISAASLRRNIAQSLRQERQRAHRNDGGDAPAVSRTASTEARCLSASAACT